MEAESTEPIESLSIPEAMRLAMELHRGHNLESAEKIYQRVLAIAPEHPDALHYVGILAHQEGRRDEAIRLMARSVELVPDHAGFHSNLGNLMFTCERFDEAEREYRLALELEPDRPEVLNNYALLCKGLRRNEESERNFLRAIELAPDFSDARNNLAQLYTQLRRIDEAIEQACEALIRDPRAERARDQLGIAYRLLKRYDDAIKVYQDWLQEDPGNPRAMHHLAALTGVDVPARASDVYVAQLFDRFSDSFDAQLAKLEYRAPSLVGQAVAARLGVPAGQLDVLDAGCGTGLCGPLLRACARSLQGVDLSAGMLKNARAELTAHLLAHPNSCDLIVSADTLVYFGELDEAMRAAALALRRGGHLCFTVEALPAGDERDYVLQHHGRYAHAKAYLEAVLARHGMEPLAISQETLRTECTDQVVGWLVMARKPGP